MKVFIHIELDETGNMRFDSNAADVVTFYGMLKTTEHLFHEQQKQGPRKVIIPQILPPQS